MNPVRRDPRRATGARGELLAAERLTAAGWRILLRNWRQRAGEIDLVARDGDCLVFVEVRTTRSERFGPPELSVGPRKQARLRRLAAAYVAEQAWPGPWRIDIVAITLDAAGGIARWAHYPHAVEGAAS